MHTTVMPYHSRVPVHVAGALLVAAASLGAQQTPVEGMTSGVTALQRAQAFVEQGHSDSATLLLGRHLSQRPNDGRAWFYLGTIHLAEAQRWHRSGHPANVSAASLLDFASTSFQPAQELLTDSGGVFRVVVAIERATLRIERDGWDSVRTRKLPAEELPLPPVLVELGRNLLASCPKNSVLLTGSLPEAVAAWGLRLQGDRSDVILLRPDLYQQDGRYRAAMAPSLGADTSAELPVALASAARSHPLCLAPAVEVLHVAGVEWYASRLALSSVPPAVALSSQMSVFHFGQTGLAGSVWTAAVRDVYDQAARRNHQLCSTLFVNSDAFTLPAIPACTP